jgi:hypothetical protein
VETRSLAARLPNSSGNQIAAAFSPNGALLLTSVLGRGAVLWNLTDLDGQTVEQAALDVATAQVYRVHWTSDGRLLVLFDAVGAIYAWGIGSNN